MTVIPAALIGVAVRGLLRHFLPHASGWSRCCCSSAPRSCGSPIARARATADGRLTRRATRSAIGVAQALALFPGISRSGITIAAGLFLGLEREAAARFAS